MLRKILSFFFALFMFLPTAHSAEMVNVEYIHQYLNARWGIDLPYNPELKNPKVAANMEYLLTVVDIANEYLNGEKTTSYGTGEYATKLAADTIATNTAIDTLVRGPFTMTTTPNTTSYSMTIGAAGTFVIDWGDGEIETIRNKPLGNTVYSHTYDAPGEYDITLGGRATDYAIIDPDASEIPTLTFTCADPMGGEPPTNLAKISGRLGRVFPTLENGKNPNFSSAFTYAPITEIPAELFDGIHGAPVVGMFAGTFSGTQITSVPANLFGELNGNGAPNMFDSTFENCKQLQTVEGPLFSGTITPAQSMFISTFSYSGLTSVPADLFAGVRGAPAERMFDSTFAYSDLASVPANLFGELNGNGAPNMFEKTFYRCGQLQTVEGPLFSGTITPAEYMFNETFFVSGLTSIPANLFGELNGDGATGMFSSTFSRCDQLQTIEGPLFSGTLTPAPSMFYMTFYESGLTSVPANLFGELNGDGARAMFSQTFSWCDQLQTIEGPLFSGTLTPAESMFYSTFSGSGLTNIPADLFAGVQGAPAASMFIGTFANTPITRIPANLFASIQGAPAESMFANTFSGTQITSIPADLFADVQGAPVDGMFYYTFANTPITSIPENLFAGISGPAARSMFSHTFDSCSALTGPSAQTNGQYLYEIWPNTGYYQGTYSGATGLSDYAQIPRNWK